MMMLQRLHENGAIHGNIHSGNVCYSRGSDGELLFINFEYATTVTVEDDAERDEDELVGQPNMNQSPWELRKLKSGRRDDVYRALFIVAELMLGPQMWQPAGKLWIKQIGELEFEGSPEDMRTWKEEGPLFKTNVFDPMNLPGIREETRASVHSILADIHEEVMGLTSVRPPPYEWIIREFQRILDQIDKE